MATATVSSVPMTSWRRWFRRTNVYIAEYILMLILVGSLFGVLASLWYSFFNLMVSGSGYGVSYLSTVTALQLGSLLILAPAAFWFYSRVTGQEMVQPEVRASKARLVFLTIWMIGFIWATIWVAAATTMALISLILGLGSDAAQVLVGAVLPGIFAVATLGFALFMVVKNVTRKFVMVSGIVVASLSVLLLLANIVMVLVAKNSDASYDRSTDYDSYRYDYNRYDNSYPY